MTRKTQKQKTTPLQQAAAWLKTFAGTLAIALVVTALVGMPVRVQGQSMMGTLHDGDLMLVTRPEALFGQLAHGDVVICRYPGRAREMSVELGSSAALNLRYSELFVKRLMGLPGDTIAVLNGQVWRNGEKISEPYLEASRLGTGAYGPRTLGADEYFVIGDNRAGSRDSRAAGVGPISRNMIVGHPKLVLWPLNRIGAIE